MNQPDLADAAAAPYVFGALGEHYPRTSTSQDIQGDFPPSLEHLSDFGSNLPSFDAVNDTAFTVAPTSMGALTNPTIYAYPNVPNPWFMRATSPFLDPVSVTPQLPHNPNWRGIYSPTPPNVVSPSGSETPPGYQDELAWLDHFTYPTPSSNGSLNEEGPVAGYGPFFNGTVTPPAEWSPSGPSMPTPAAPVASAPVAALGKRRWDEFFSDEIRGAIDYPVASQKRVRDEKVNGVLRASGSMARTRHKPAARIPKQSIIDKPKEAGRGAERLASPNPPGIYQQPLLGPGVQQGWAVVAAERQPTWVEGSVGVDAVQQRQGRQQQEVECFKIPELKPEHRALLAAAQDKLVVPEIRCKLCPGTTLKTWEDFKRHCEAMEAHPLSITFCDKCGDYFARTDSLGRHRKTPPRACTDTSSERAKEKREVTEREHEAFKERLRECLRTGEDIGKPFWQIIKERFPESSKKQRAGGKREQSRLSGR